MKHLRHFIVGISLLICLSIILPTTVAHAADEQTYEVNTILNVRDQPAGNAEIVGLLSKGDLVVGFKEEYGWVQTYYGGQEAWVAKHHLIPVSAQNEASSTSSRETSGGSLTVTASSVNIRSGPSLDDSIIASTSKGNTYNIVETSGDWHEINLANGSTGWIAAWLTDSSDKQVAAATTETSSSTPKPVTANQSLEGYTIVLDPGHGGKDPGAIGLGGIYEKDLVTSTASKVIDQLQAAGATVIATRSGDYFVSLDDRVNISNTHHTDAFVSLHYDSFPAISVGGVTTYFYGNGDRSLAQNIQSSLASTVSLNNRGILERSFRVLRDTTAPSVLVELGFVTNPSDMAIIKTADYQNQVATAITNGLINYFHN